MTNKIEPVSVDTGQAFLNLADLCRQSPPPEHVLGIGDGWYLVDTPPDVKRLVEITDTTPGVSSGYTIYTFKTNRDRGDWLAQSDWALVGEDQ